jgi:hypothetical protein
MDYFSQNEASQLVKTALNAAALKLNGVRSNVAESQASAAVDAAYMLALYRELLGPAGAAATMEDSQKAQQDQQNFQAAMQQVIAAAQQPQQAGQQSSQQPQQASQQNQQQNQQGQQPQPQQAQQPQAQQPVQQAAPAAQPFGQPGGGAQTDYKQFIPEAYRQHIPEQPPTA